MGYFLAFLAGAAILRLFQIYAGERVNRYLLTLHEQEIQESLNRRQARIQREVTEEGK